MRIHKPQLFLLTTIFIASSVLSQPTINSFSPASGPVGTSVTITGTNFNTTPVNNIVFFGAVKATVTAATATSLTVTVPSGTNYQPITVTVNGLTAFSKKGFIVTFGGGVITSDAFLFATNVDNVTGIDTDDMAIADMNDDGKPDIIVVDNTNGFFAIYRNTTVSSTISFAPRLSFQVGGGSHYLSITDIDGDGKKDVLVTNSNDNNVSIFRNTTSGGSISFASFVNITAGSNCIGITATDIDGDGKADIATVGTSLDGKITLIKNTSTIGNISFAPKSDLTTIGVYSDIINTDINDDNKPDLVLINFALNVFSVLRNTSSSGTISFATKVDFATDPYPLELTSGDIDGDGKNDISVSCFNLNFVSTYRNTSSGPSISFGTKTDHTLNAVDDLPNGTDINDMDGDSKPDLSVLNNLESIEFFKNNSTSGNIVLGSVINMPALGNKKILSCDFNADSKPDLAIISGAARVAVFRNRSTEPQITSFSPATSGSGATITISGGNFTGVTAVSFGGVPASSFTVVNSTTITAVVGSGASGNVTVVAPHGTGIKAGYTFVQNPTITSFTPTTGITGLIITITGTNLTGATALTFGGVPAASFTVVNATTITAVVGSGASGNISVTTPGGTASRGGFTYIPMPDVISFTPTTGTINTTVTITGTNFTGASDVRFGGIPAGSFTVVSPTTITATVLGGSSGAVRVTTPGGADSLNGFTFIQPPAPVVTSFAPTNGAVGTVVTITGNNFNTTPSLNYVYFGPARAVVSSANANSLTVAVPSGAAYGPISVTTNFLTAFSNNPFIATFPDGGNVTSHSFEGPFTFTASVRPQGVCTNDLDGDGKNDLISANDFSSTISVLRNNSTSGTISFAPKVDFYANYDAWRVLSSEIDGDGKKDIVVANHDDKKITVLKNTSVPGTVSFAPYWSYSLTQEPWDISAADFDNDGKTDLAVASYYSLSVIRNTSVVNNISLAPRIDFITPLATIAVATGDIDRDGKPDIVYLNNAGDSIYIMRNTSSSGTLSFASPVGYPTKSDFSFYFGPTDVAIGDLDNDSKPEIVVANTVASQSVSIFKNNSTPGIISFPSRNDILTGTLQPDNLSIEDIDGDGKPDIAFSHHYVPRTMSILKNIGTTGNIAFAEHVDFTDNGNSQMAGGIGTGDFDGDGRPEVFAGGALDNLVYVFRNKTNGPHITSFSPMNGLGGTTITITGLNFTGATAVSFGNVPATSFAVVNSTTITAVVGVGAAGDVKVTTPLGIASAPGFLYGLTPTITSFTPTTGTTGTLVTITGTNLAGITDVSFGGTSASSYTGLSLSTLTATVFNGASGNVSVTAAGGTATLAGFTYVQPAPIIDIFSPLSGIPGTVVSIQGSNFQGTTQVAFGGVPATSFTLYGTTTINAVVGNGATGSVSVTTPGGTGSKGGFTFSQATATISSFIPTTAATGATITISGTNFAGITAVTFGGVAATSFVVNSSTSITAVVASGSSGNVSVTTPGGTATLAGFTFIPTPVISSFTPTNAATGATITITGTNFTGATAVRFGGVAATSFVVNSSTSITAIVASGASGNVSVTTPGGTATLSGFTFIPAPVISSFTPTSAATAATITITGTNFTGVTAVTFGGIAATSFVVNSSTSITAIVGTGATGNVSVTTPGGTATATGFTYNAVTGIGGPGSINSNELIVNPNPAKDFLIIKHPATNKNAELNFYDILGRKVKTILPARNSRQTDLTLNYMTPGIYTIVWSDGTRVLSRIIVIN